MTTKTKNRTAHVEVRSISPLGTWPARGPDKGVSVQIVPNGVERLKTLNSRAAEKRGIEIINCGVGYYNRTGPASMYGRALAEAKSIAAKINGEEN